MSLLLLKSSKKAPKYVKKEPKYTLVPFFYPYLPTNCRFFRTFAYYLTMIKVKETIYGENR